jgi:hypothetical protein
MKPLQKRWLRQIGETKEGKLGAHVTHRADRNACQALLDAGLITIETAFEGGLFVMAITDAGQSALAGE